MDGKLARKSDDKAYSFVEYFHNIFLPHGRKEDVASIEETAQEK